MARFRITCAIHDNGRIVEVGCQDSLGSSKRFSEAEAISLIDSKQAEFFVERPNGHTVEVFVETNEKGHRFLKTRSDGQIPNNLDALPTCKKHIDPPPRVVVPARSHGAYS